MCKSKYVDKEVECGSGANIDVTHQIMELRRLLTSFVAEKSEIRNEKSERCHVKLTLFTYMFVSRELTPSPPNANLSLTVLNRR